MRCFIAIDLTAEVKEAIRGVIEKTGQCERGVRWVPPDNIHLTLKFLGEVKEDLIPEIAKKLTSICAGHETFSIKIKGTGAFPNYRNPNVLWVGIDYSSQLERLFSAIDGGMSDLGFAKETRKFAPHLTLGRVKDKRGIEPVIRELSQFKDTFFGIVNVNEVLLMKSVLKPSGAEYSKVAVFKLEHGL